MTDRDLFFKLVKKESTPVLSWFMAFFNKWLARELLGEENVPGDSINSTDWTFGAPDRSQWEKKLNYAGAAGHFAIGVGYGGSFAFGHGGPGEFREKLLEQGKNHVISVCETGVKKEVRSNPHFYRHYDYPVTSAEDLDKIMLPDPNAPERYNGIAEEAAYYKQRGYIAYASLNGFFSGLHYFLCPYDELLVDLLLEEEFVDNMLQKLGNFNLKAAEHLLECGIDMINFCDDLGSGSSLLMSPETYRRFFFPWHKKLADLCHRYGAYLHMHSHGSISSIVEDLYEAGIDLLNPNDPYEGMDLPALKQKYGDRMTFVGGLDKFFFDWDSQKQKLFIKDLVERAGGGFILMDSGGVPENVTPEAFRQVLDIFAQAKSGQWT